MSSERGSKDVPVRGFAENLVALLRNDLDRRRFAGRRVPVSFSGGLDSTLVAKICSELTETYCIVAGTSESTDIKNARGSAKSLGLDLVEVILDEGQVVDGASEICRITGSKDPLAVSFELPTYLAMKAAKEEILVTGQGADELFGGYAKYEGLSNDDFWELRRNDIGKVLGPIESMEGDMASHWNKSIIRPFLCNRVVAFALALPLEAVRPSESRKPVVREALRGLGLTEVASLPKKASQYGSGASKLLEKAAKKKGQSVKEMIEGFGKEAHDGAR